MRDALSRTAIRVIDLFHEWDDDNSGTVSRAEFRKAMPMLGFFVPRAELDALFDEWDLDKSGSIEIGELSTLLRRGGEVELDPSLMPGGAGEIELGIDQKYALRKEKVNKDDATRLQGFDIDEGGKPINEQVGRGVVLEARGRWGCGVAWGGA